MAAVGDVSNDVSQYRQRLVGSLLVLLDNSIVSINKSDNVLQRKKRKIKQYVRWRVNPIIRPGGPYNMYAGGT